MAREASHQMLTLLLPDVERDGALALRSSGGRVELAAQISLTVLITAVASYLDVMMLFGSVDLLCMRQCHLRQYTALYHPS